MSGTDGLLKFASAPIRRYMNRRFSAIEARLDSLTDEVAALISQPAELERATRARWLERVDLTEHNRGGQPPHFADVDSHAVSAEQCVDPTYRAWFRQLLPVLEDRVLRSEGLSEWEERGGVVGAPTPLFNRKAWEWAYIAEMACQGVASPSSGRALGFGVGNEPLPALFASWGMDVVATDQAADPGSAWAETGQLMRGINGLARPHLIATEDLAKRLSVQTVDMNAIPADIGSFDLIWCSCSMEHLGSPDKGLQFARQSCRLLRPGGLAVHTTELELTSRATTADHGRCAVYRVQDIRGFAASMRAEGYDISMNTYVSMDTPHDRWIDMPEVETKLPELAELKVLIGDSVTTSFGLMVRKPRHEASPGS